MGLVKTGKKVAGGLNDLKKWGKGPQRAGGKKLPASARGTGNAPKPGNARAKAQESYTKRRGSGQTDAQAREGARNDNIRGSLPKPKAKSKTRTTKVKSKSVRSRPKRVAPRKSAGKKATGRRIMAKNPNLSLKEARRRAKVRNSKK